MQGKNKSGLQSGFENSAVDEPEGFGAGAGEQLPATLYLVAVNALGIHVAAVANQQLELAVGHGGGVDTDKSVAQLVKADDGGNAVCLLVALPAAI